MTFDPPLKRKDLQGDFLKINYEGTFGSLDKDKMMKAFSLAGNDYLLAMGDSSANRYENFHPWIHKDAIIVSVYLYDANKKFVQNISPATAVMAVGPEGEFLTCSVRDNHYCSIFFSAQDNIFKGTDDKKTSTQIMHFTPEYTWLSDKSAAEGLIGSKGTEAPASTYEFIQYPEVSGKQYMTNSGEVKEIVSGKTIATDCKSFAEHRYATVIGVLKNDGSCYLGYTYLGDEASYKKGLQKVMDNAKEVVAGGVCDADNNFYRWKEEVIGKGMDKAAWSRGEFIQYNEYKLSLEKLTGNAVRVFPNEYFTAENSTAEEAITGFVQNGDGKMWAFGLQNKFEMGNLSLIKHIFCIYKGSRGFDNANFVGLLPEDNAGSYGLVANHCTMNHPKVGELGVDYLSDVPGGFKATDGYTYAFDNDADDGSSERRFKMKPTTFHYLNDGSEIFKALNTTTNPVTSLYLPPNVARSSYGMDNVNGNTVLLERTDGSMRMTQVYPKVSAANIVAKLGGWECSNAIRITQPTTKKTATVDYVDFVSGGTLSTLFNLGETKYPETKITTPYIESDYYTQITPSKVDRLYREGKTFLLLICRTGCNYCKMAKPNIKTAIEREQVPIYGCIDDTSSIQFFWDYIAGTTATTPLLVLVRGKDDVAVKTGAYTQSAIDEMVAKALLRLRFVYCLIHTF